MKVIIAQGNPGQPYAQTRHNIGWILLDSIASRQSLIFLAKPKFFAEIAETSLFGEKVLLVKPTTFYNETGRTARALMDFYKFSSKDLLVLHDDLALPFGTIRIRQEGSDAGNKGVRSINAHIGPEYTRIRIGIANDHALTKASSDFVLSKLLPAEHQLLKSHMTPSVCHAIDMFVRDGHLEPTSYTHASSPEL